MTIRSVLAIAGLAAGALWIGRATAPSSSSPPSPPAPAPTVARATPFTAPTIDRAAPRAAIPSTPPAAVEPPPTATEARARDDASELIADAGVRRHWGGDDWTRFDELLGEMAPEQRQGALEELAAIINEGGMTLEPHP